MCTTENDEIADEATYWLVQNGEWCNARGEILGRGELSPDDFRKAQAALHEYELWVVITNPHFYCERERSGADQERNDLAERCSYIIRHGHFYLVSDVISWGHTEVNVAGISFRVIPRSAARQFIAESALAMRDRRA